MYILPLLGFLLSSTYWYHDVYPDITTVILKTSPNNENRLAKSTIRLDSIKYQSNAIRLESRHVAILGNGITNTDVFEGRMNKGTLFSVLNSTCSFSSLSFHPHTSSVLHAAEHSFCEVSQSKIVLSDPVSPFECTDSTIFIDSTDFVVNTPSNTVQSLVTSTCFSSSMKLSSCSLQDVLVASDSSFTASSLIQHTIIESCHLQNISHVAKRTQSPPVTLPFNVTVCCSSLVDCVNTLSGGIVRNVEDQTTLRAINNTFTRTISNGHDEGKTFENLTEADVVEEDHSYLFCVFRNCTGTQTAGGAIRCRAGFSVSVTSCEFYDNAAKSDKFDYEHILADGGAIHFNGQSQGGLTIVQSLFERNQANVGGSIGSQKANHLNIQYSNITDSSTIYYNDGAYSYGGGIALSTVPMESIMKNIRLLNCSSERIGGSIDCNYMSGSIIFSNLFIALSKCTTGNVIFSNVKDTKAVIQFFSCTFFENIATDNSPSYPSPNDIRYYIDEPWPSLLQLKSTFVNCFSNSPTPKIGILNGSTYTTTFNYGEFPNSTELDVHLPPPAVIVNEQEGEDKTGCGTKYDNKCNTIAYAGKHRMAEKAGIVLIEAGRFQETDSFDLDTKSGSFTSFGDLIPIISFALSDGAPTFVTKGTGTVRFESLHFVPSADTSVVLQNGNGVLGIANCQFLNTDELNPLISTAILKAVEGEVSLSTVEFSSLSFDGGCCVECVGTSSKLDISNCKFLHTKGASLAQIVFEPSTPDSAVFSMKSTTLQGQQGSGVGGLKLTNVVSIIVESVTIRHLESKTQKAAISIAKCSSLTLSSLLFELNSGTDASDLFVDSESLPVVSSTSSFSVSPSPTASINGEQSDTVLPRQVLFVDASSATQGPFCWATDGCKTISSLLPRLSAGVDWSLSMKEGMVGEQALNMSGERSIAVTGTSQAGSILQHTSLISSAFVEVSTGSLSLSQLTLATASTDLLLSSSFFIVSGGSLSLESVLVPSLSFSNSASFTEITGSGSLSLKSISFSDMSNEGSGSVVHSTSIGTISLDTVSFTRCNCGKNGKGRSVMIEPSSPFTATSVVMKDVTIEEEGTSGSHEVFLKGSSISATITSSNFGSTLGALADQTRTTMAQFVGEETSDSTMSGPLAYLLHRHETGTVYVDSSFWNHKFCGLATLPCQTLETTHEKLNENDQIVDFSSDLTMTGTVTSKATSSTIQSTATKTLTLAGSAQFVVNGGALTLNALKLTVEDISTSRTTALFSVSTSSLAVSACSITIIDQTNTVPLVSVEGGSVTFSGTTCVVNPPLASSILVVSGGSLSVASPLSVTHLNAARTTPLFDLNGGTTTLSSSVKSLFTSGTVFSVKPTAVLNLNTITDELTSTVLGNLVMMTGGSVELSGSFANGKLSESLVSGSGNLLIDDSSFTTFSPLSASNAESRLLTMTISTGETVQIGTSAKQVVFTSCSSSASGGVIHATVKDTGSLLFQNTKFASCSSSADNGGALAVIVLSGSLSLHSCRFQSCSSGNDGGAVWLDLSKMPTPSQYSLLQTEFGTGTSANKASGMGDCVFVVGDDLRRVIVRSRWRGSFEEAKEGDLWGSDQTTAGMCLLWLLQSRVIGVGEGGRDDATGTIETPFKTFHRCFVETDQSDGSFAVVVIERTRIGESSWLVDQLAWTMDVSGSGSSSQSEVLCSVSDKEKNPGTTLSSAPNAMITLSGQTLSFLDILFSSFFAPRSMQFVFSLLASSSLTLSSCSLCSSSPISVSLVSVSGSSFFSADSYSMSGMSFVGKSGLVQFGDASRIALTSCSFSSISLEGALLWGTTSGAMKVTNTDFSNCCGTEFGSVIRMKIVGITATITNCSFTSCSTEVRLSENGERSVVGGGCVVVEMMTRKLSTRGLRSSSVDLTLSSFSDCTLTNTDTSSSQSSLAEFVGGSGFLIFGNEKTDHMILRKVILSRCLCGGFGKMIYFDGGVVVGRRRSLFTDHRDISVRECRMGSIHLQ